MREQGTDPPCTWSRELGSPTLPTSFRVYTRPRAFYFLTTDLNHHHQTHRY